MGANKELEAGLKAMAEDFHLPGGGRKKLSLLVAQHMNWFDAAERRGMGWRDMIRALTTAGVTSRDGKPLSVGTLSSTVWRKRAEAENATSHAGQPPRSRPLKPIPRSPPQSLRKAKQEASAKIAAPPASVPPPPKLPESGKPDRNPATSRSIHEKLARVAMMRGVSKNK